MFLQAEREQVVAYARRLGPDGLALGTSGNVSLRTGDNVVITPSAVDYDALLPRLVAVVDLEGRPVDAPLRPSSELPMHLAVYRATAAQAVVHTHAPFATALSTVVDELPPLHYLIGELGGPVRVAPYETFGTPELASAVATGLDGRAAVILGNHGTLTIGDDLETAYARSLLLEWLAALYHRARALGTPRLLRDDEVAAAAAQLARRARGEAT